MPERYFEGDLLQNEMLNKVARQRQRKYEEKSVPLAHAMEHMESYVSQGWKIQKMYKRTARLRREKRADELLEDEVWLLFKNMGFTEMNKDRNFKIQAGPVKKQIDVFARDGELVFVVECKASTAGAAISAEEIREFSDLRGDIFDSVKNRYKDIGNIAVSFVMATKGIGWSEANEALATGKKISIWKEAELEYYGRFVKHLGSAARFQIYSIIFPEAKMSDVIKVPAICGGKGKAKYYCFVIQPEKLLQVAYVHHRRSTPEELQGSYQRMLDKSRLNKISTFITRGGYFANNIILNFTHKPTFHRFEKEKQVGDLICGILEFPRQYASAWIIDGQHRLYGYADNPKKSESTVPVLAFESLDVREQAKLFVDINKEQRAVPANLLWDLYSDIYYDSLDKEHQLLRTISLLVKKLNSDSDSPLRDHVSIPSVTPKDRDATNLTIATICDALKESGLISAEDGLLYKTDYDSTVDFACEVIKVYFDMIANAFPEDWEKGDKGLLRTNIGVRILVIILRQLLKYLRFIGRGDIYIRDLKRFKEETQKYLSPMLSKVKEMSVEERDRIREASAKGLVANNAQQWAWWIKEEFDGFGLEILRNWAPPVPEGQTDQSIQRLLEDTERRLRVFISQRLETVYGAKWFGRIDKEIRDYIQKKVEEEIARERWKESQLISLPPDKKMRFTTTGHLKKIIEDNWDAFEDLFLDKQFALAQFKSFVDLRHVYAHHREEECDIVVKNLGYWATRWIRKCIGLNKAEEAA